MLNKFPKIRLSVMMFIQFVSAGALSPILTLYLTNSLHFTGYQTGLVLAMSSIASFVSPIVSMLIADRFISSEKLFAFCHFAGAGIMSILAFQKEFWAVLVLFLVYYIVMGPTFSLVNAIVFHKSQEADRKKFGNIRMFGTMGWIAAGWIFSWVWLKGGGGTHVTERIPDTLKFSAIISLFLAVYTLVFISKKKVSVQNEVINIKDIIKIILRPAMIILIVLSFLMTINQRYYMYGAAPFLKNIGINESDIMPALTLGQISEMIAMGSLGFFLIKFGYKKIMIAGALFEIFRYVTFMTAQPLLFVLSGLFVHGFAYTLFFMPGIIYLDHHCDKLSRTGVHQLFTIFTSGFGNLIGSILAGFTADLFMNKQNTSDFSYSHFWVVPIIIDITVIAGIFIFFKNLEDIKHRKKNKCL